MKCDETGIGTDRQTRHFV